jgi:hypothetical protein
MNYSAQASDDFAKARKKEIFSRILNLRQIGKRNLLSLEEVKQLLKPKKESYRGIKAVSIELIIGSEGRYRDFNRSFLPKHDFLKSRWMRVDTAHLTYVNLPPIKLYEIGGVYFVRDGNHRVSVAKSQGVGAIDAEIISLNSEVNLQPHMDRNSLKKSVIEYEKQLFLKNTKIDCLIPDLEMNFTATGRYDEIIQHIHDHKYYINQDYNHEIPLEEAILSWYDKVYKPIKEIVHQEKILGRFPGRTESDLYVWIVKHWDDLKKKYGEDFSILSAAHDFKGKYGRYIFQNIFNSIMNIFKKDRSGT